MTSVSITHPSVKSAIQPRTETWKHESVVGEKRERSSVNMYVSILLQTAKATLYNLESFLMEEAKSAKIFGIFYMQNHWHSSPLVQTLEITNIAK